ncbi:MAG TPA: hypothetical protein PK466_00275 [Thermotogota bacterium]|nr:hypothetical protein [Thermotogota bacterium]HPJ87528.1 hypothetical protein [Thermotogota bacterium]HPR94733.1 hypothetical protein [Thermotogota bacterium]
MLEVSTRAKFKRVILFFSMAAFVSISSFSMMFEIGGGYRFAPGDISKHGINIDTGIFNDFNDIIELDIAYHPQFLSSSGEESATPTIFWNFDADAMIPLLGRQDGMEGYRFGIYTTFEFGSFYSSYTLDATPGTTEANNSAWDNADYWLGAGVYGQYFLDPWLFEMSLGLPVMNSYKNQDIFDQLLGSFTFKGRYFIKSDQHNFKDHLTIEFEISTRKVGLSAIFLEPF